MGTDFTQGKIGKNLFFFTLPLLLSSLIQQLYGTVNLIIVGKFLGTKSCAAVGASDLIITCLIGFFYGMAVGANVVAAHLIGENAQGKLKKLIETVVILGFVGGIILMLIGFFLAPTILTFMGTPDSILTIAVRYLRIYMLSMVPIVVYNLGSGILRAMGDGKYPMYFQLAGGLFNVGAGLLLVGVLNMGIEAVAFVTFLSQSLALFLLLRHFHHFPSSVSLALIPKYFEKALFRKILQIGIPAGVQSILITLSNILIQVKINGFGVDAIAAFAGYFKIEMILYLPILALGQGVVSFVGQNYGAGQIGRIKKGVLLSMVFGTLETLVLSGVLLIGGEYVFGLFSSNEKVIAMGIEVMTITFPFYFLYVILECVSGELRGIARAFAPMVITLVSFCLIRISLLMWFLSFSHKLTSVAATYPLTWFLAAVALIIYRRLIYSPKPPNYCKKEDII